MKGVIRRMHLGETSFTLRKSAHRVMRLRSFLLMIVATPLITTSGLTAQLCSKGMSKPPNMDPFKTYCKSGEYESTAAQACKCPNPSHQKDKKQKCWMRNTFNPKDPVPYNSCQ